MGNDRASLSVRRLSSVDVSEASTDGRIRGVWRTPSVLGIALAEVLSSVGTEMTWLALPWFVLTTTHSPARMGIVFAVEVAPTAILGIPAGSIVDRYGARWTMLVCDLARAPLLASFPMLHDAGLLSFPVLLALVAVIGVFTTPYLACQRLILPEVVGEDEARVAQANTVVEGARNGAGLVGPAVAGVLIASIGALNVLWIDAASYAVSFLIVLAFVRVVHRVRDDEGAADGVLAGLRYALADPMLRSLAVVVVLSGFWAPLLFASLPVLAFDRYGADPRVAGLLFTSLSAGLLAGAVVSYRALAKVEPVRLARFAIVWIATCLAVLIVPMPAVGVCAVLAAEGLLIPSANAPAFTLLTTRVEANLRARVLTAILTANTIAGPIGYALVGPCVRFLGLAGTFAVVATFGALTAVLFLRATRGATASAEAATGVG